MKRKTLRAFALALAIVIVIPAVVSATWPVADRSSYISQGYTSGHRGIDIAAPRGTTVVPISTGKVVYAGYRSNCGGYQVWIRHGSGLYSAYYHLSREVTYAGDYVTRDERIGYVGTSGCASGPHLHVEMWTGYPWRTGSHRVNPWRWLDSGTWLPHRYR
jgi:murein DD-endopeptidase MepM/ murein hydrolase activator NlpD